MEGHALKPEGLCEFVLILCSTHHGPGTSSAPSVILTTSMLTEASRWEAYSYVNPHFEL